MTQVNDLQAAFVSAVSGWMDAEFSRGKGVAKKLRSMQPWIEECHKDIPKDDKAAPHADACSRVRVLLLADMIAANPKTAAAVLAVASSYGIKSNEITGAVMLQIHAKTAVFARKFWGDVATVLLGLAFKPREKWTSIQESDQKECTGTLFNIPNKLGGVCNKLGWRTKANGNTEGTADDTPAVPATAGGGFGQGGGEAGPIGEVVTEVTTNPGNLARDLLAGRTVAQAVEAILLEAFGQDRTEEIKSYVGEEQYAETAEYLAAQIVAE